MMSDKLLKVDSCNWMWNVIFGACWPNDVDFLIERVEFVYNNYEKFIALDAEIHANKTNEGDPGFLSDRVKPDMVDRIVEDLTLLLDISTYENPLREYRPTTKLLKALNLPVT